MLTVVTFAQYIIIDAPFQVNLPDLIVRKLEIGLKNEFAQAGKKKEQKVRCLSCPVLVSERWEFRSRHRW